MEFGLRWKEIHPADRIPWSIVTLGGLGFLPFAPGSVASAVVVGVLLLVDRVGWLNLWVLLGVAAVSTLLTGLFGAWIQRFFGKKDPRPVVIDEVAGQAVAVIAVLGHSSLVAFGLAFFLFRVFDVLKPLGVKTLEKAPGGWGVVFDDVLAGVYAALVLWGLLSLGGF